MRPDRHHYLLRRHPMLAEQRQAVFDDAARRPTPSGMDAADIAPVAGGHQHRQAIRGHHPYLLPAQGGEHRVGVRPFGQRELIVMDNIAVHQLNRRHLGVGKSSGLVHVEEGVADAGNSV